MKKMKKAKKMARLFQQCDWKQIALKLSYNGINYYVEN